MKLKPYSLAVRALHSRLQLIRNKLDVDQGMTPNEVVERNLKYFKRAGESVELQHEGVRCDRFDFHHAAELFLTSVDPLEKQVLGQPLWKGKKG